MSSVSAWSTAAAVPKYDGARHTRVSRHFCIGGADLESWVHCVVHIFYPFWPNWMEGNKGIPACPKYPPLPCHGLTGKCLLSELPYKLVPSTILIEKIAFMWTWKIKNFFFILRNIGRRCKLPATGHQLPEPPYLASSGLQVACFMLRHMKSFTLYNHSQYSPESCK